MAFDRCRLGWFEACSRKPTSKGLSSSSIQLRKPDGLTFVTHHPLIFYFLMPLNDLFDDIVPGVKSRAGMMMSEVALAHSVPDLIQTCRFPRRSPFQSCRVATLRP